MGKQVARRALIVVDVETNGLDPERHQAVEVACRQTSEGIPS